MNTFLGGLAITVTIILMYVIFLLYKKPTTNNEISKLTQKTKRNKGSNINNDITPTIEIKEPRKGLIKRILTKRKKV